MHEAFLLGAMDQQKLAGQLDQFADREGRFRINEVFCLEGARRDTVGQLMRMSDAIVLDVRGFGRARQGVGFEIELLGRSRLLPRVLAVGDATTDWEQFDERIRSAGCEPGDAMRTQIGHKDNANMLMLALMRTAIGTRDSTRC